MVNYEKELEKLWEINILQAAKDLASREKWAVEKAEKYYEELRRNRLPDLESTFKEFLANHANHKFIINEIAKDPAKQSAHQNIAAAAIQRIPGVYDFKSLPAGGKSSKFFRDGDIVNRGLEKDCTKSIDFEWYYINSKNEIFHIYAAHKHTKDEGGGQDNQYNDLKAQMEQASYCTIPNTIFLAIADGLYYLKHDRDGISRLEFMNRAYGNSHAIALTINEIEDFLKTL